MTRTPSSPSTICPGRPLVRRWILAPLFVVGAASCSRLPVTEVSAEGDGPTTTYVTTPPTSAPITSAPTTTAAPTTVAPTTVAPTTVAPTTTAAPTTTTTRRPTTPTTAGESEELEELPYTGPSEAVLFALIGLTMVVAGRSVLDLSNLVARFGRSGDDLPPR